MAVALPALQAGGDDELFKENNKRFEVLGGSTVLTVTGVDAATGDFGGTFVSKQVRPCTFEDEQSRMPTSARQPVDLHLTSLSPSPPAPLPLLPSPWSPGV
jgi:hypothetical protein